MSLNLFLTTRNISSFQILSFKFYIYIIYINIYKTDVYNKLETQLLINKKLNKDELFAKKIGLIMDGNRRWSKNRSLKIINGYRKGLKSLKNLIKVCPKYNIEQLTVFAFSTENWSIDLVRIGLGEELEESFLYSSNLNNNCVSLFDLKIWIKNQYKNNK